MIRVFTAIMICAAGLFFNRSYALGKFSPTDFSFIDSRIPSKFKITFSCPISFGEGVNYGALLRQSTLFLSLENGIRLQQEKTMSEVRRGEFFPDWFNSVKSFHGWGDGNKIFTNWVAHPTQGSVSSFIFANNDDISQKARFGMNSGYFIAKKRQFAFAVFYSVVFELGPISEASIGNVGLHRGLNRGGQSMEDFVLTPVLGILWSAGEDAVDFYWARNLTHGSIFFKILASLITPTRSLANILAFHLPWYRWSNNLPYD